MAQTVKIKSNTTDASAIPSSLQVKEIAANILDRSLFIGDGSGVIRLYTGTTKWFNTDGYAHNALKLGGVEASNYATQSWVGDNYLSKKGGSLSGDLNVSQGNLIVSVGHTVTGWLYPKDDALSSLGQGTRRWSDVHTVLINGGTPIHSGNYSSYALPLTGGTIKGSLYLDYSLEKSSRIYFIDRRIGSEGYADEFLIIRNGAGVNQGAIGLFGNSSGVTYYYFGHSAYNGNNLRIYSDKVSFGDNTLYHTGNFNPANYLPLSGGTIESPNLPLQINRLSAGYSSIGYSLDSVQKGILGFDVEGNLVVSPNREINSAYYHIIHTGNYTATTDKRYLRLSGGTITSDSYAPLFLDTTNAQCRIQFRINAVDKALVGYNESYGAWLYNYASGCYIGVKNDGTPHYNGDNTLIHTGNIHSYNAGSATKLKDNTAYTAWGQTYFENGVPKSVSGNLHLNQSKIYWHSDANNYYIGSYYDGTNSPILDIKYFGGIRFFTNAAERMRIATNGNILVGTTTDSGYKLYVAGTGYFGEKLSVNGGVSITAGNIDLGKNEISNAKAIHCYDSGTGYYVGGRNYGLGATDGGTLIYSYGATPISFYTNTSERMKITGGGNVLIGITTDSGYKVDINGSTRISGIQLVLGNANGGQILFQRPSANYIWAYKAGGYLAFGCLDQGELSLATSSLVVSKGAVYAGATTSLGTSTYKWSKIYGVDIYAEGGWLRTSADNTGLYNSTGDARWYYSVSAGSWVSDKALKIGGNIVLTDRTGSSTTSNRLIFTRNTHDDDYWDFGLYAQSTKGLTFFRSSMGVNTDIANIDGNGNLAVIGGGAFGGDIWAEGTIAMAKLASSSDAKLKENVKWLSTDRAMNIVRALRPTEWNWKKDHTHSFGFIAQDVQPVIPEMVSCINDTLRLEYNQLHAFEVGAIQHIDSEMEQLKKDLKVANTKIEKLENELKQHRRTAICQ